MDNIREAAEAAIQGVLDAIVDDTTMAPHLATLRTILDGYAAENTRLRDGLKKIACCEFTCLSEDDPYCECGVEDYGADALSYCWAASAHHILGNTPAPPEAECNACVKWGECDNATRERLNDDGDCSLYAYDTRLLDTTQRSIVYAERLDSLATLSAKAESIGGEG